MRCRIAPHIIPFPWALAVTDLSTVQMTDTELPTLFEFTQEMAALTARWSPAIWTWYSNINFDEEILRHAFYLRMVDSLRKAN
jgi:exodeoxyribonuclease-1